MNDLLLKLADVIEELYTYKQDSGSFDEEQKFSRMITTLNKVYNKVYDENMGA